MQSIKMNRNIVITIDIAIEFDLKRFYFFTLSN